MGSNEDPSTTTSPIRVSVGAGVAKVRLSRPETRNALTLELLRELATTLRALDADEEVRVVVLSGDGRGFCSGWDTGPAGAATDPDDVLANDALGRDVLEAFDAMRTTLSVAQVHGAAVGGGVLLAAACDFRVAAEDAFFWLPEVSFGNPLLWTGLTPLVREVGFSHTRFLALSNERADTAWAQRAGLVHRVVPTDELPQHVADFAQRLTTIPARGVELMKADLHRIAASLPATHGHSALDVLQSLNSPAFTG